MPNLKELYQAPSAKDFAPYLRPINPSLDANRLTVPLLVGHERADMGVPFTGDASLVVVYESKGRKSPGAIASFEIAKDEINVLQLQGVSGKGYRVNTGLRWVPLVVDRLQQLVEHPQSELRRITVPNVLEIAGIRDASSNAFQNYRDLAARLDPKIR